VFLNEWDAFRYGAWRFPVWDVSFGRDRYNIKVYIFLKGSLFLTWWDYCIVQWLVEDETLLDVVDPPKHQEIFTQRHGITSQKIWMFKLIYYRSNKAWGFCMSVKSVPLQSWSGPEGYRMLTSPDFMTTAQNGSKVISLTHRQPLRPGNTHFC
jgi:hypothetical protein